LEDTALTWPCTIIYGDTKITFCPNCYVNPQTGRSTNRYRPGGPVSFASGKVCPYCSGLGNIEEEQTETLYLALIYDQKQWLPMGHDKTAQMGENYIQSLSKFSTTYMKLVRAKELIMDTSIEGYSRERYVRDGEPMPAGFGSSDYVVCMWKKVQ
jgi:hypothetical protein